MQNVQIWGPGSGTGVDILAYYG